MSFNLVCPECKNNWVESKGLSDFECLTADQVKDYTEPFSVTMPLSGDVIKFRLLRIRDQENIENYAAQLKQKSEMITGNPTYTYTLAQHIIAINDDFNSRDLQRMAWVRKAIGGDLYAFRTAIEKVDTGYRMRPRFFCRNQVCPMSRKGFRVQVTPDFLRAFSAGPGESEEATV